MVSRSLLLPPYGKTEYRLPIDVSLNVRCIKCFKNAKCWYFEVQNLIARYLLPSNKREGKEEEGDNPYLSKQLCR
jgi:hypothetical protein